MSSSNLTPAERAELEQQQGYGALQKIDVKTGDLRTSFSVNDIISFPPHEEKYKVLKVNAESMEFQEVSLWVLSCAQKQLVRAFVRFAYKIAPAERNDFFDARNADTWMSEFAQYLREQIDPDRPSND